MDFGRRTALFSLSFRFPVLLTSSPPFLLLPSRPFVNCPLFWGEGFSSPPAFSRRLLLPEISFPSLSSWIPSARTVFRFACRLFEAITRLNSLLFSSFPWRIYFKADVPPSLTLRLPGLFAGQRCWVLRASFFQGAYSIPLVFFFPPLYLHLNQPTFLVVLFVQTLGSVRVYSAFPKDFLTLPFSAP